MYSTGGVHSAGRPPLYKLRRDFRQADLVDYLQDRFTLPNVEVRRHDIRTDPLEPGTYDLAHCRAVLVHLPEPHLVVRRMVAALRSGGWLLVEEGDLSSLRAVDASHPLAESFSI